MHAPAGGPRRAGAIHFLTDYGDADELAGVVRAVLARLAPGAPVVDLTHQVAPFDVRAGALALERAAPHLGPGVVLAVVDPGVGTDRLAVAVSVPAGDAPRALVGPDNGLLARAADALGGATGAVALAPQPGEGRATFDGRDVFAPAAAALWRGAALEELGEPVAPDSLVRLPEPGLVVSEVEVAAEVLWVDRFGNVQLAARPADGRAAGIDRGGRVELRAGGAVHHAPFVRAFAELDAPGVAGAEGIGVLVDANGRLAVVCARQAAATVLGVREGDTVTLRRGRPA
ncbi:MAG: SAM-dependent chlorinase/fluorinase [Acidobacteriota bacterium]|nr:SAM-dependent chlorinase/fluorinase [Acidobacteriota bacterium]